MRSAGVRLPDGNMVWADAGDHVIRLLDHVTLAGGDGTLEGTVVVTPDQMHGEPAIAATVVAVTPHVPPDAGCADLPGAFLPPLGSELDGGIVTHIDAVNSEVTITRPNGEKVTSTYRIGR